jgi:serine protease
MVHRRTVASVVSIVAVTVLVYRPGSSQAQQNLQSGQLPRRVANAVLPAAIDRGVVGNGPRRLTEQPGSFRAAGRAAERVATGGSRYVPGRVLVKFRSNLGSAAERTRAITGLSPSASLEPRRAYHDCDTIRIGDADDAEAVARELMKRPDVQYAQPDYRVYPRFVPNDSLYQQLQWNLRDISLERAWDIQRGASSDVIVAVLDSGLAFRSVTRQYNAGSFVHEGRAYPALGPIIVPFARAPELAAAGVPGDSRFVAPRDFIWNNTEPLDFTGHGTHVAGTIGQLTNNSSGVAGVAFNVRLMPVKVLSEMWDDIFNSPFVGSDSIVAQGIRYAVDNGARVINMSLGRFGPTGSAPVVEDAVRYAVARGAFLAVAGGNSFEEGNDVEVLAEIASRVQGAVSVAATDRSGNRAYYSNTGPWVEVAAPGGSFRSGGNSGFVYQQTYDFDETDTFERLPAQYGPPRFDFFAYIGLQGASMATPHVAGLGALLYEQGVTSPAAIEAAIKRFADDLGSTGRDDEYGAGRINARRTLQGLGIVSGGAR